jgi:hypothetical protein
MAADNLKEFLADQKTADVIKTSPIIIDSTMNVSEGSLI